MHPKIVELVLFKSSNEFIQENQCFDIRFVFLEPDLEISALKEPDRHTVSLYSVPGFEARVRISV